MSNPTLVVGYVLSWVRFNEALDVQAPDTPLKLRIVFAFLPCVTAVIAIILVLNYKLDEDRVREVRAALEARRAGRGARQMPPT